MNAIFTICTPDYLYQAVCLINSFAFHNAGYKIFLGYIGADYRQKKEIFPGIAVDWIHYKCLEVPELSEMEKRYRPNELCFSLKPFFAKFILSRYPEVNKIFYLDGDVIVFNSFDILFHKLDDGDILFSAHSSTPFTKYKDTEVSLVHAGIYNAGFFGIKRTQNAIDFLDWWGEKLITQCIGPVGDQRWLPLATMYFKNIIVDKDIAVNLAHWKLHEVRNIENIDGIYFVNNQHLLFYHYSGLIGAAPDSVSLHSPYKISDIPGLGNLIEYIQQALHTTRESELLKELSYKKKIPERITVRSILSKFYQAIKKFFKNDNA